MLSLCLDLSGYDFSGFYVQTYYSDGACTQYTQVIGYALGVCFNGGTKYVCKNGATYQITYNTQNYYENQECSGTILSVNQISSVPTSCASSIGICGTSTIPTDYWAAGNQLMLFKQAYILILFHIMLM